MMSQKIAEALEDVNFIKKRERERNKVELFKIPEAFTNKLCLAIISALVTGEKNFKELQHLTDVICCEL